MKITWKWRWFLPLWVGVFLLAPSYWIHSFSMFQEPPPGSEPAAWPLFQPFGALYCYREILTQARAISLDDGLAVFVFHMVPFIVFTFLVAAFIYAASSLLVNLSLQRAK
jgi:hypothetical protein